MRKRKYEDYRRVGKRFEERVYLFRWIPTPFWREMRPND